MKSYIVTFKHTDENNRVSMTLMDGKSEQDVIDQFNNFEVKQMHMEDAVLTKVEEVGTISFEEVA